MKEYKFPEWVRNTPETRPPVSEEVQILIGGIDRHYDTWDGNRFDCIYDAEVTHWMPCPPLPEARPKRIGRLDELGCHSMGERAIRRTINALIDKVEGTE